MSWVRNSFSWGGPLGPLGSPWTRSLSGCCHHEQADGGVGRGPGGPPHDLCRCLIVAKILLFHHDSERVASVHYQFERNAALLHGAFRRADQAAASRAPGLHHVYDRGRKTRQGLVFVEHCGAWFNQRNVELVVAALLIDERNRLRKIDEAIR